MRNKQTQQQQRTNYFINIIHIFGQIYHHSTIGGMDIFNSTPYQV